MRILTVIHVQRTSWADWGLIESGLKVAWSLKKLNGLQATQLPGGEQGLSRCEGGEQGKQGVNRGLKLWGY